MLVKDIFAKDIFRSINGVVKADQLDETTVWQELDEFVVTKELDTHLRKFFSTYVEAIDHPKDADISGRIGVWVSGFFGSGKSHFIKILSYLLQNGEHRHNGSVKKAVDFFESKVQDAMLYGDIKRAVASNTDVILFNIDSKADARAGRNAILSVFLKVLNEMQGYSPDHPHIAHMERYIDEKGKLADFHDAYRKITKHEWKAERDAYEFNRDEVIEALSQALGQSKQSCEKWIDKAEDNFSLTIENFCKWVQEYLEKQGSDHRIIFLVDEVGQFIGGDTHLMLNLQTITENLGTVCRGRAWVVVTSQEDIDAVLGDLRTTKSHDFSKIQGRFKTRLALSGSNVDEVIQERLLAKKDDSSLNSELETIFQTKGDILRNQLTFSDVGVTIKQYNHAEDFRRNYPFAPYQFQLVQKIFEAVRRVGATGLHLSKGERSMLDAFQSACQAVAGHEVGVLVPLYRFYPSIESFLDTTVKKTIDQATRNDSLKPFDVEVLRVLFLIRYVDEMRGNVNNLVTLCIDQIDADRLALKRQVEEALQRLEKDSLISRNGDNYFFLTNEEQDVNRAIKEVHLSSSEEAKILGVFIFNDIFKGIRKHRYRANKKDFAFNRMVDGFAHESQTDKDLMVHLFTPLGESNRDLLEDGRFLRESGQDGGKVLVKLSDDSKLARELRQYLQTEKYLKTKSGNESTGPTEDIIRNLSRDNQHRGERIKTILSNLLADAAYFAAGQRVEIKTTTPTAALDQALEYLIDNSFPKMAYISRFGEDTKKELQAILKANDIQKAVMDSGNEKALEELRGFISLSDRASHAIVLFDMIERFDKRPYGWPEDETLILLTRLLVLGEIQLLMTNAPLPIDKVFENITAPRKQRSITVIKRKMTDPKLLQVARNLGKDVFSEMGPDSEDGLFEFLKNKCQEWLAALLNYKTLADTGNYPGQSEINTALSLLKSLIAATEPAKFIERFLENKDALLELTDDYHDLDNFYRLQKPVWEKLRKAFDRFGLNRLELERDEKSSVALRRMQDILQAPSPYTLIHEAEGLIATVEAINSSIVTKLRNEALARINQLHSQVIKEVETANSEEALRKACLSPLESLREAVLKHDSVAHIAQAIVEAERALDTALGKIEDFQKKKQEKTPSGDKPTPVVKPRREIKPSSLVKSTYLETNDDINGFLDALRRELEEAVARGERIQIR